MALKNRIKAVIFDLDGVIFDGEPIQSKSWEILIKEQGINPIYNKVGLIHNVGPAGNNDYLEIINIHNLKGDIETIRKRRREIYVKLISEKLYPFPGFWDLIYLLKKHKLKIAVASNRMLEHVHMILDNIGAKNHFEIIAGPSPVRKHKPAPDIYLHTAQELGFKPKDCVALEDSEVGIIAAHTAGIKVIAVPNQFTKHHDFSKADKIVSSLKEIDLNLITSLREPRT